MLLVDAKRYRKLNSVLPNFQFIDEYMDVQFESRNLMYSVTHLAKQQFVSYLRLNNFTGRRFGGIVYDFPLSFFLKKPLYSKNHKTVNEKKFTPGNRMYTAVHQKVRLRFSKPQIYSYTFLKETAKFNSFSTKQTTCV